ncbi:MAG: DNA replication and repair protein RecF [Pseudomonadota bacterium]
MIRKLTLRSVRSYGEASAEVPPGICAFFGPNGSGKTTVLEAACLLGTTRSFRTTKLRDLIRTGEEAGVVEGVVGDPEHTVRIELDAAGRTLRRDGREVSSSALAPEFRVVALAPEHQQIIVGVAEERRRYLDYTLFSRDPGYLGIAQQYRRAIRHKQALLRDRLPFAVYENRVAPWDEKIAELGTTIRDCRAALVRELGTRVRRLYQELSAGTGEVALLIPEPREPLLPQLSAQRRTEHAAGRALCGPHRDDLEMQLNGQAAARIASQGEKASFLLALKLAELEILEPVGGDKPALILDDLGVTLDQERRKRLFEKLAETPHQTLISTPEEGVAKLVDAAGGSVLTRSERRSPRGFSIAWRSAA